MPRKKHTPEEIFAKLRQVDVVVFQGSPVTDAIRQIRVTKVTYYRWRQEYGGLKLDQMRHQQELEIENAILRKAVSDLTLDKLILKEAARGNYKIPGRAGRALRTSGRLHRSRSAGPVRRSASTGRHSARSRMVGKTRNS